MWSDCQVQKKKNSRSYQRTLTYLYLQKLKCPKCNRILGGKATTKKNGNAYFYYYCNDCKIEFKEKVISDYFNHFINELVEYDSVVNQFFLPMIKQKKKGRNRDIDIKDMGDYREIKKQLKQKEQKLTEANKQTKTLDNKSANIIEILDNLKSSKLNKNNMLISSEDVQKSKNYTKDAKIYITQTVRSVNDLNMAIKDFEHSAFEIEKENCSLKYEIEQKDDEIGSLKKELSAKDKIIGKLQAENEKLKQELKKFKDFWYSIMSHFHKRICYYKDNNYKIVSDDLYKNGIFDNNDNEIANNIARKVTIPYENKQAKNKKRNLIYNTKENFEKFDNMLKSVDEEYRTTIINFGKYKLVMFAMAKLMKIDVIEQNKVALYLFNSIRV